MRYRYFLFYKTIKPSCLHKWIQFFTPHFIIMVFYFLFLNLIKKKKFYDSNIALYCSEHIHNPKLFPILKSWRNWEEISKYQIVVFNTIASFFYDCILYIFMLIWIPISFFLHQIILATNRIKLNTSALMRCSGTALDFLDSIFEIFLSLSLSSSPCLDLF